MSVKELVKLIKDVNKKPIQRDTLYNTIKTY
jgi:2-iminoacetate synthase ThiH